MQAAADGDPDAMENVAFSFLRGTDGKQDFAQSAHWFRQLAETGNSTACYNIGLFYARGCGVEQDFGKAVEWLKKAEAAGDEDAAAIIPMLQNALDHQAQADEGEDEAEAILAEAHMLLGKSLDEFGEGEDFNKAVVYARRSAVSGNAHGMYLMGLAYEHGRGVAENKIRAAQCYAMGAQKGYAPSQWNLACCYMTGQSADYDRSKAISPPSTALSGMVFPSRA